MPIVENRKAFHDYFVEDRYEAGLVLAGWEVKAIRAGRAQISDAYVIVDKGALWLIGAHISPLLSLVFGILILIFPRILNILVAIFLIIQGLLGLGLVR